MGNFYDSFWANVETVAPIGNAPTITTQPTNQTVTENNLATFTVTATGTEPLTFQWYKNDVAIDNSNSSTYSFTALLADNNAIFKVTITNAIGSVTSDNATLSVNANSGGGGGGFSGTIINNIENNIPTPVSEIVNNNSYAFNLPDYVNNNTTNNNISNYAVATHKISKGKNIVYTCDYLHNSGQSYEIYKPIELLIGNQFTVQPYARLFSLTISAYLRNIPQFTPPNLEIGATPSEIALYNESFNNAPRIDLEISLIGSLGYANIARIPVLNAYPTFNLNLMQYLTNQDYFLIQYNTALSIRLIDAGYGYLQQGDYISILGSCEEISDFMNNKTGDIIAI